MMWEGGGVSWDQGEYSEMKLGRGFSVGTRVSIQKWDQGEDSEVVPEN